MLFIDQIRHVAITPETPCYPLPRDPELRARAMREGLPSVPSRIQPVTPEVGEIVLTRGVRALYFTPVRVRADIPYEQQWDELYLDVLQHGARYDFESPDFDFCKESL